MKESEIVYENGGMLVHADKRKPAYVVYRSGATHSTSDSAYSFDEDGLSIAKARADYLAKYAA